MSARTTPAGSVTTAKSARSERNIVVREIVHRRRLLRCRRLATLRLAAALIAIVLARRTCRAITAAGATATTALTAAQHLHLVGDDVGGVLLLTVLAGVLVVADRALDVHRAALAQVFAGDLA